MMLTKGLASTCRLTESFRNWPDGGVKTHRTTPGKDLNDYLIEYEQHVNKS